MINTEQRNSEIILLIVKTVLVPASFQNKSFTSLTIAFYFIMMLFSPQLFKSIEMNKAEPVMWLNVAYNKFWEKDMMK